MPRSTIDELGNGATQGEETVSRAVAAMATNGKVRPFYELAHVYSDRMALSPFADPISLNYRATNYFGNHAANGETVVGEFHSQGTKLDALGHFGFLDADGVTRYFGGLTQDEVKPTESSPLLHLGIDQVPPIVTSGLLLDATMLSGRALKPGEQVTAADLEKLIALQHLRDLQPGDVLLVHTGWEDHWRDDNDDPARTTYYRSAPGLSADAARFIASKRIVCLGMDVPFLDAVNDGYLEGTAGPPDDASAELPFAVHHSNLAQAGIYQVHNMHLAELAADEVYLSAVVILPIRIRGGSFSNVRPIAIGSPHRPA